MRNILSKTAIAWLAAFSLGASIVATSEPAAAGDWHGGGGGHGGWHPAAASTAVVGMEAGGMEAGGTVAVGMVAVGMAAGLARLSLVDWPLALCLQRPTPMAATVVAHPTSRCMTGTAITLVSSW